MTESTENVQRKPGRQLVINTMLSLFASAAVFVIVAYVVLVPQLARHEARIRVLEARVAELQEQGEAASAAAPVAAPATAAAAK